MNSKLSILKSNFLLLVYTDCFVVGFVFRVVSQVKISFTLQLVPRESSIEVVNLDRIVIYSPNVNGRAVLRGSPDHVTNLTAQVGWMSPTQCILV